MNKLKTQKGSLGTFFMVLFGIAVLALIVGGIAFGFYHATNKHDVTFTVNKTERITTNSESKYMVYTDNGVYENTDSVLNNKFNSSDLYNEIKEGKKYTCTAVGFRNGFTSNYENLITCKEIESDAKV
jgi:hypothetical protein